MPCFLQFSPNATDSGNGGNLLRSIGYKMFIAKKKLLQNTTYINNVNHFQPSPYYKTKIIMIIIIIMFKSYLH